MNYFRQVRIVTLWEYQRFYKLKNELLGILVMLLVFGLSYAVSRFALSGSKEKSTLMVIEGVDSMLIQSLSEKFVVMSIPANKKEKELSRISEQKEGILLVRDSLGFEIFAWKRPSAFKALTMTLDAYSRQATMEILRITPEQAELLQQKATVKESYFWDPRTREMKTMTYFFAGLMILAIFLSFTYQFTAITGEKQLKITEQIVSAIRPQVWMDGKILGITLTGMTSMLTYSVISILGGILFFQFTGTSLSLVLKYLHLPSIALFLAFTLVGILIWNSVMAGIASVITDPNNSGKSSLMLLPVLFVIASFLVIREPDSAFSVFLSWFPITSATAMPVRWAITEVAGWQVAGSFLVLCITFWFLRKLAARIFHVSILISGKEPTWKELVKMLKER